MFSLIREQPPAFSMIFMLEIWERFGYYTVQGILTLYFIRFLGFSELQSYYTFGAFSALMYGMVAVGGYLGDKVLGTKRTIVLGLVTLSLGYLALALATKDQVFLALGLVCVGNGIFKANPAHLLTKCYKEKDPRLHGGFTLYYMAVNLGSIFALIIGPSIAAKFGYFYAYFLSFLGLIMGLLNYYFQRELIKDINTYADNKQISWRLWLIVLSGIISLSLATSFLLQHIEISKKLLLLIILVVLSIYLKQMLKQSKKAAGRMFIALILMLEAILFFALYQQMPTSLTLFAVNNVHSSLMGIKIDPQSFQVLNPLWIVFLSPFLAYLYKKLNEKNIRFTIPYKFAAGMFCCGLAFSLLYLTLYFHNDEGIVSSWWLVGAYFFQSSGELLVSALGIAMVAELVPSTIRGFVIGIWFLTSSIAGFLGASLASYTAMPKNLAPGVMSLTIYAKVFGCIGLASLTIGSIMWLFAGYLTKIIDEK